MRKLKLLSLLMLICFSVGNVWAETVTYTVSTASSVNGTGDVPTGSTATVTGNAGLNSGMLQLTYGKNAVLTLTGFEGCTITGFKMSMKSNSSKGKGSMTLVAGTTTLHSVPDATFNSSDWYGSWSTSAVDVDFTSVMTTDYTVGEDENIVITVTNHGTSNATNSLYIGSYTITYEVAGSGGGSNPSLSVTPTSWDFGEVAVSDAASKVFSVSGSNLTTGTLSLSVPAGFSVSPSSISVTEATLAATNVTVSKNTTTIDDYSGNLSLSGCGLAEAKTVALEMSVVADPEPTGTFELFSGDLVEGEYVICSGTNAMKNVATSAPRIDVATVTISEDKIQNPDESLIWKIEALTGGDAGKWTIYNEAVSKYAAFTTTNGRGTLIDAVTDYAKWTTVSDYEFVNVGNSGKYLRYNPTYGFASYANSTGVKLTLYKKSDGKPAAPTFTPAAGSFLEAQNVTISAAAGVDEIRYTLDGSTPTSASTLYTGAIPVSATTTIKAIAIKDAVEGHVATATYTITTPLSVAAAIALIPNANDQVNDQFVEGYVCTAGTSVSSGKMTYYISADGSETNRLQIFKGKNLNNVDFSEASDLAIGDKVVVFGQLKNYSGTPEMNDGNYIVRRTAKGALSSVVVSGSPTKTAYSADEAFEPEGLVVTATYASGYAVNVASGLAAGDWSASPATVTANGNISVTATYDGMTSAAYEVPVTVLAATLEYITLSYYKVDVYQGKPLPKPVVTAHWSDASESDVTALVTFVGYDASEIGEQDITVTYTAGGDTKYDIYEVTVKPIYNVELTASVAKDLIETVVGNTESTSDMIVRGKVSQVGSISSNCLTYYISDDGTTTNHLEIYKGKYLDNANFTNANKLKVGDEVVITGKVIYYNNSTAEFANGKSQVTSLARTPNFTIADVASFEVGAADLTIANLTITQDGEGAVTLESSDHTEYVSIVDGKLHAVAEGTATITANLAANDIYKAATTTFEVTVAAAGTLPEWAYTYTSNVTLTTEGGTSASAAKVVYSETQYNAIKAGTGSVAGAIKVSVPAQATKLHFHAYAWNGETVKLTVTAPTGVTVSPDAEISINANTGIASNSPFTLSAGADPKTDAYYVVELSGNTTGTTLTFTATTGKRFVLFGVNQEGGVLPVLESIEIKGDLATKTGYKAGGALDLDGLTVEATYSLGGVEQSPVDITDKLGDGLTLTYDPLVEGQTSVTITATFEEKTDDITITGLEAVAAADPKIFVEPNLTVNFGSVEVGDAVPAAQTITINLTNVAAVTATLGGTNPEAFSISKTEGIVSGDEITISVLANTDAAASYSATITISDGEEGATDKTVNLSFAVTAPVVEETAVSTTSKWVVATAADLVDGKQVLITGVKDEVVYAIGEQNDNNRAAVAASVDGEGVLTPGEKTMSFTLVAQDGGTFALQASNGEYLYAASSSKNYLKRQATIDDNAKWTLSPTSAIANGTNTNETLRFNGTNNPKIFSCYADETKQLPIQFYVPQAAPEPVLDWEDGRTGLTAGKYYTICLPKKVTNFRGATIWDLKKRDTGGTVVYLEEAQLPFVAGTPFIIQATAETLEVVYEGDATGTPVESGALRGTLTGLDVDAFAALVGNIYILKDNAIRPRTTGNWLSANRAYIEYNSLEAVSSTPLPAPGKRVRAIPMQTNVATGIDVLNAAETPVKMMIDGQLFILRGEKLYDATGRLVK